MVSISLDTSAVERRLTDLERKQEPFARMLTLNAVGAEALGAVEAEIERVFDRPTRWTKKAFYLRRASKRDLVATIERKGAVGGRFYLEVQAEGGARPMTGVERLISRRLPYAGDIRAITPAGGAKLNAYGNLSPALVRRILSGLKVQTDGAQGGAEKSGKSNAKRARYFAPKYGGALSPGVYERAAGKRKIKKVLHFSDAAARYSRTLDISPPVRRVVADRFADVYAANLRRALASAR